MKYPPIPWLAYACLALSTSLIGSYVGIAKLLLLAFPVFLLAWLRFGLAAVMMLGWLRQSADELPLSARSRWLLFWESFLGNFLFSVCLLYGLKASSAMVAGVILAGIPAAVALLGWLLLGERISRQTMLGLVCSVTGIAMVALERAEPATGNSAFGALLLVAAMLCEASYVVIGKQLTAQLTPKRISALINLWGLVLVTPFGIWQALSFDFSAPSATHWGQLLFYAAAASIISVWLWMTGLQKVPAAQAGVFQIFLPLASALVGLALGEQMSLFQAMAFGLALLGLLLATWPKRVDAIR